LSAVYFETRALRPIITDDDGGGGGGAIYGDATCENARCLSCSDQRRSPVAATDEDGSVAGPLIRPTNTPDAT